MEVGVLPKPDMWTHHRMKHPAAKQPDSKPSAAAVGSGQLVDLSQLDSDDED